MRLRNKQTGEIKDVESLGHEKSLRDKYGPQITLSWNTEYENLGECRTYSSLAELNAEWEDAPEEPKEYWFVADTGEIRHEPDVGDEADKFSKEIGNYFETKEEAEKAVDKLKAWKRLKDKGFRFKGYTDDSGDLFSCQVIRCSFDYSGNYTESRKDLDLLFGGEE